MDARLIGRNTKFAFIALEANTLGELATPLSIGEGIWATSAPPAALDDEWKDWIGSIKARTLREDSNLFLCAAMASQRPQVLDAESHDLDRRVSALLEGLLLTGNVNIIGRPLRIGGANVESHVRIRQIGELEPPLIPAGVDFDEVSPAMLLEAATLGAAHLEFASTTGHERIRRILAIYYRALRERNVHERLHQFARCVEGFISAKSGETASQFKSRTELFLGPRFHLVTGRLYEMRSSVEHMNAYSYPVNYSERDKRLEVMRMAAFAQGFARYCIRRLLGRRAIWPHFESKESLAAFWLLEPAARQEMWGEHLDVARLRAAFDTTAFDHSDLELL